MVFGTRKVCFYPGKRDKRSKKWQRFREDHQDHEILTEAEYERAEGMARAIRAHKKAMEALDGEREQTFTWDRAGLRCRGTPDVRTRRRITDLKTARTADPERFPGDAIRLAYHGQLPWYVGGGVAAGLVDEGAECVVVAVEPEPPFVVTVFKLTSDAIEAGERLVALWFEQLKGCVESNVWPSYTEAVAYIDVRPDVELTFPDEDAAEAA